MQNTSPAHEDPSEGRQDSPRDISDVLDSIIQNAAPVKSGIQIPDDWLSSWVEGDGDEYPEAIFGDPDRDLEDSVRRGFQEEMDAVARRTYRNPRALDVAREDLRRLGRLAETDPQPWLDTLEAAHEHIENPLPIIDGTCRIDLTDYARLKHAADVIPAAVPSYGLVVMFNGREIRARNGRRFHQRAWADYLDDGVMGPTQSSDGSMSKPLRKIIESLADYTSKLRRWKEI